MSQNRFWQLLAKKLSGEAAPDDLLELEQLIKENPEWVFAAEHIESLWKLGMRDTASYEAELAFEMHLMTQKKKGIEIPGIQPHDDSNAIDITSPPSRRKIILTMSALVVIIFLVSLFTWQYFSIPPKVLSARTGFSEVSTNPGSKTTKLVLPDSTLVWLNAGSRLTYSEGFGKENRNATLSGEAFFEVKKGSIPFIIQTNQVTIKVLGTAFNVRSYPNENTETSLIRGKVEITMDKRPGEVIILNPNEKLIIAGKDIKASEAEKEKTEPMVVLSNLTRSSDQEVIETSWMENRLVFQDEAFDAIVRKMERWYNVEIEIADREIAEMRLTGAFEKESILQALTALKIAFPFHFNIEKNKIVITK